MMRVTETVKQLIIINIIFFVGSLIVGPAADDILAMHFPLNPDFKVWQPLTYMFMHDRHNFLHIIFNMIGLWMFGSSLEQVWGAKKLIFFYISCGLGAVALHIGIDYYMFNKAMAVVEASGLTRDQILAALSTENLDVFQGKIDQATFNMLANSGYYGAMLGASGALYGITVAFAFVYPDVPMMMMFIPIPIKAKYLVPGLLALDLFLGLKGQGIFGSGGDGIAHFAHLGGALIGFIMMWYWKKNSFNNNRWN
ncbi:rhomboid family intramembrane serine protease [Flavobacterium subsaxonicum]|uniref:Protease n=1 Tax=Flavobacterium subsaxonicum WB 4.1-42 = DSM 21790 TaxID=1121898 RepID=A0A0A2N1P1_9FLAO|nr:rhomboid family intramembrane serine protease [Flavobacterium subsaxonicum]KGO94380.1 protease [Flavobacterium subsaxonicum WB 4.1-42 = DSM 21790]